MLNVTRPLSHVEVVKVEQLGTAWTPALGLRVGRSVLCCGLASTAAEVVQRSDGGGALSVHREEGP